MPLIRYVHPADIARHGEDPVEVSALQAKVLVIERRRAVAVLEVAALDVCDDCPAGGCADCED